MNQPKQIRHYQIREKIGRGAMATVYRAYDPHRQTDVALKVLHPKFLNHKLVLQRFKQEARAVAFVSLRHPNIIQVHDFGHENAYYYIAMDYISGGTLQSLLKERGPLSPHEAVSLLSQIAEALHEAHQIQLVHRDIKPVNILIDQQGKPILSDFGIARVQNNDLTQTGTILGTPYYMSPEQATGEKVSKASDIYTLGVVLFQAVTGRLPFTTKDQIKVMYQHVHRVPPRPRSINPAIGPALEEVILKALEKKPQDRFWTAQEMAEAMQESLIEKKEGKKEATANSQAVSARKEATANPQAVSARKKPRTNRSAESARRGLALLIVALLLVLLCGGVYFYGGLVNNNQNGDASGAVAAVPPTHTQEPTHTTLPGQPTSTPRPTFTPPPESVGDVGTPVPEPTVTTDPLATQEIAQAQPTAASQAPSAPTATAIPATATPIPPRGMPTFAAYSMIPQPLSPNDGQMIASENVTFEWEWSGQPLQPTHQFVLIGIRDGQEIKLAQVDASEPCIDVRMGEFGDFETTWRWYVTIEDQNGKRFAQSGEGRFEISLSSATKR